VQPKDKHGRADEAVVLIVRLYRIERKHKGATVEVRMLARQQYSVPALTALHAWMLKTLPVVTPKSALGTVLSYLRHY
jgi:transposase